MDESESRNALTGIETHHVLDLVRLLVVSESRNALTGIETHSGEWAIQDIVGSESRNALTGIETTTPIPHTLAGMSRV